MDTSLLMLLEKEKDILLRIKELDYLQFSKEHEKERSEHPMLIEFYEEDRRIDESQLESVRKEIKEYISFIMEL